MAVADRLDILADLRGVVRRRPSRRARRWTASGTSFQPSNMAQISRRSWKSAGECTPAVVDVEDRAPDGAPCQPLSLGRARQGSRRRPPKQEEPRVIGVVEAVQPRQDEVGGADQGGHGAPLAEVTSCAAASCVLVLVALTSPPLLPDGRRDGTSSARGLCIAGAGSSRAGRLPQSGPPAHGVQS